MCCVLCVWHTEIRNHLQTRTTYTKSTGDCRRRHTWHKSKSSSCVCLCAVYHSCDWQRLMAMRARSGLSPTRTRRSRSSKASWRGPWPRSTRFPVRGIQLVAYEHVCVCSLRPFCPGSTKSICRFLRRHFPAFQHGDLGHSSEEDSGRSHHGCSHRIVNVFHVMVDCIVSDLFKLISSKICA